MCGHVTLSVHTFGWCPRVLLFAPVTSSDVVSLKVSRSLLLASLRSYREKPCALPCSQAGSGWSSMDLTMCPLSSPSRCQKVCEQQGCRSAPSASTAPDMTTSLIQDYVPGEYERNAAAAAKPPASDANQDWPQLPSTPEDGPAASGPRGGTAGSDTSHAPEGGGGAQVEGGGGDMTHWPPSPEMGHGYAEKRLNTEPRQGPRPFSTPGPHRGRLLG